VSGIFVKPEETERYYKELYPGFFERFNPGLKRPIQLELDLKGKKGKIQSILLLEAES